MDTIDIWRNIDELRAELRQCILTRKERRWTELRIEALLAEAADRAHKEGEA
jgi:predicted CoA-binding protein